MDDAARAARAAVDGHGVDPVVTGDSDLADWAKRHGYQVRVVDRDEATIYEIRPADVDAVSDPEP
jgi:hypothetical protein